MLPSVLLLAAALLPGCGDTAGPRAKPLAPVLVIGVDGLEWRVLREVINEGRAPNLAGLMERGSYGSLTTFEPTLSPVLWTTISTGKLVNDHRIKGFIDSPDWGGTGQTYTSTQRGGRALWNICDEYGLTSNVFGWWITWPAEEIRGMMVSGVTSGAMKAANWKPALMRDGPDQVHPAHLNDEVLELAAQVGTLEAIEGLAHDKVFGSIPEDALGVVESEILIPETLWSIQSDATFLRLAEEYLGRGLADLNCVYFGGADVSAHRFWRYYEPEVYDWPDNPEVDAWARAALGSGQIQIGGESFAFNGLRDVLANAEGEAALSQVVPNYYAWIDEMVGRLLAVAGEDVTVVVISDHGMHASSTDKPNGKFVTGHHQDGAPGVLIAAGPGIRQQGGTEAFLRNGAITNHGTILHVAPTLLALLGIPRSAVMQPAWKPILTDEARLRADLEPVPTHDEGFRKPSVYEVPDEMDRDAKKRLKDLGYLEMEGAVDGMEAVDPETFEPDTGNIFDGEATEEGDDEH